MREGRGAPRPESHLPPGATAASRRLLSVALELAQACPPSLGREVAVTGSVCHGIADAYSDIEMAFWVESLPTTSERVSWLRAAGAEVSLPYEHVTADGSRFSRCWFHGVQIEPGWQSFDQVEAQLAAILRGEVIEQEDLEIASIFERAVPLRTKGWVAHWQEALQHYPPALAGRLIDQALEYWDPFYFPGNHFALAMRQDDAWLAKTLVWDIDRVMRILFAVNQKWEPDIKWIAWIACDLPLAPQALAERITAIFTGPDRLARVRLALELIDDTLALVDRIPDAPEPIEIRESIRRALAE